MIALISLAVIADTTRVYGSKKGFNLANVPLPAAILSTLVVLYFVAQYRGIDEKKLETVVRQKFPVAAVEFVRTNRLSGHLFNRFDWGGHLLGGRVFMIMFVSHDPWRPGTAGRAGSPIQIC